MPGNKVDAENFNCQMACLIRVPTEIVKSRTQTSAYGAGTSSLSSATNVLKYEGFRGFYRGFGITLAREVSLDRARMDLSHLTQEPLPKLRSPSLPYNSLSMRL